MVSVLVSPRYNSSGSLYLLCLIKFLHKNRVIINDLYKREY